MTRPTGRPSASTTAPAETSLPPSTLITLHLDRAPIDAAIAELSKQSGFDIKPYMKRALQHSGVTPVTVALDNQLVVWEKIERQLIGSLRHHPSASCLG